MKLITLYSPAGLPTLVDPANKEKYLRLGFTLEKVVQKELSSLTPIERKPIQTDPYPITPPVEEKKYSKEKPKKIIKDDVAVVDTSTDVTHTSSFLALD